MLLPTTLTVTCPLELPAGYSPLAVLPASELGYSEPSDAIIVLASRVVDWRRWEAHAEAHATYDDGIYERGEETFEDPPRVEHWTAYPHPHPAHVRYVRGRCPENRVLAGVDEHGVLRALETKTFEDLSPYELERIAPDLDEDERAKLELSHWSSKIGGKPSFSQAKLRALSKRTGEPLGFLAQIGGDAAYDPYGYRFYLFGNALTGELSVVSQR